MKLKSFYNKINFKAAFLILLVLILLPRFGTKMLKDYPAWDFFPTYNAAKYILTNSDIYGDLGISAQYTRSPVFALLLYPLGLLPRNIASFIWCLLSVVALGTTFVVSEKLFLRGKNKRIFWILVAPVSIFLLSRPLISEFLMGQVDIIMLGLIMLALFYKEKGRLVLSALFLVIAASIKVTPLVFLFYFLLKKEFKLIFWTFILSIIFLFLPAIFVSWKQNLVLLGSWLHNLNVFYPHEATTPQDCWYQSLQFFFKRFLFSDKFGLSLFRTSPDFARYLNYAVFLLVMAFLVIKPKDRPKDAQISYQSIDYNILIIGMTIFSPLAADYTYINMIVPIMFMLLAFKEQRLYKNVFFIIATILFLIFNFFTGNKSFRLVGIDNIKGESYCYLVVMTLVWQALILLSMLFSLKYGKRKDSHSTSGV